MFTKAVANTRTREKMFTRRRVRGFRRISLWFVRGMRRQGEKRGQVYLPSEGQGVSGKDRLKWFAGCGGKRRYQVNPIQRPKGRAFQEKIG